MLGLLDDLILYSADSSEILRNAAALTAACTDEEKKRLQKKLVKSLLEFAEFYGFDGNLWHKYVAYCIASDLNPFSLGQERRSGAEASETTADELGAKDCAVLRRIFNIDKNRAAGEKEYLPEAVTEYRRNCGLKAFGTSSANRCGEEKATAVSDAGKTISEFAGKLEEAEGDEAFFNAVSGFYRKNGAGEPGLSKAFILRTDENEEKEKNFIRLSAVKKTEDIELSDLIGYEEQKRRLIQNTEAFLEGKPANNVLLYGDGGTGKSTSIRAICNQYCKEGLRIIQVYRHQMKYLSRVIDEIKNRNFKFIIYMDDLSFEDFETEYKYLKAVIEGGIEPRPANVLIYATSNRRHLIKETWKDRSDMEADGEIHWRDSMEEKLSLAERFGVQIYYGKPTKEQFHEIVEALALREGLNIDLQKLHQEATRWEIRRGGVSGRSARQFIDYMKGLEENTK